MSPERSKFLWITVAASAFVLVVAIAGVFLFYPKNRAPAAPATMGNTAAPKPPDPQDYLNAPTTAPTETKRNGDVIVIYGDKPQSVPPLGGAANPPLPGNQDSTGSQVLPGAQGMTGAQGVTGPQGMTSVPAVTTTTTTTTSIPPAVTNPTDGSSWNRQPSAAPAASAAPTTAPGSTSDLGRTQQAPAATKHVAASSGTKTSAAAKAPTKAKVTTTKNAVAAKEAQKPDARQTVETKYWIQTASFTERGKADNLRDGLASKGLAALIAVKDISGKSWYRVRVGPYQSAKEASGWLAKVKLVKGCDEAYVTSESMKR